MLTRIVGNLKVLGKRRHGFVVFDGTERGEVPLFDYADLNEFDRDTEEAYAEPRLVVAGGTGAHAFDFVRAYVLVDPDDPANVIISPNDLTDTVNWLRFGSPPITGDTDVAPDGTTTADTLGDDGATFEFVKQARDPMILRGVEHIFQVCVKKDSDQTRFPDIHLFGGFSGFPDVSIDTKTGQVAFIQGIADLDCVEIVSGWWMITLIKVSLSTPPGERAADVRLHGARGLTLGAKDAVTEGDAVFWGCSLKPTLGVGTGPWALRNEPVIFADGALRVHDAHENLVTESFDYGLWTPIGTPVLTGGEIAPDGTTSAWEIEDDNASLSEGITRSTAVLTAGPNVFRQRVRKDAITSRFPEFAFTQGAASAAVQLNTSTGATVIRAQAVWTDVSVTALDAGDFWILELKFTTATVDVMAVFILPAFTGVFGDPSDVTITGSIIIWGSDLQAGAFARSHIRTKGGAGTEDKTEPFFTTAPVTITDGIFVIDYWVDHASGSDAHATECVIQTGADSGQSRILLNPRDATHDRLQYRSITSSTLESTDLTLVPGDKLTLVVNPQNVVSVFINNVLEDAIDISSAVDNWASGQLAIGQRITGDFTANGVISRARAL